MIKFSIQYDNECNECIVMLKDEYYFIFADDGNFEEDGEGFGLE